MFLYLIFTFRLCQLENELKYRVEKIDQISKQKNMFFEELKQCRTEKEDLMKVNLKLLSTQGELEFNIQLLNDEILSLKKSLEKLKTEHQASQDSNRVISFF